MSTRMLVMVALIATMSLCRVTVADDLDKRAELDSLKAEVAKLNERISEIEAVLKSTQEQPAFAWEAAGLTLAAGDQSLVTNMNERAKTKFQGSVTVKHVDAGSAASTAGIQPGDQIVGIAGFQTLSTDDAKNVVRKLEDSKSTDMPKFFLFRNNQIFSGKLDIPAPDSKS